MKIGIIGTNFVSDAMVEASLLVNEFELTVVCSRNIDNAKAFAEKHNIANYTDNHEDFLDYNLDAVYIAVPNVLHKDLTIYFLNNKIPVFCEKPMASNYDEVKEMIDASVQNNTLLMEGIVPIYTDAIQVIKDNLSEIGQVRSAIMAMNQYSSRYDAYREGQVLNAFKPELSNGSTMDIGLYPLSVSIALFGKPESISASAFLLSSKVDGKGTIVLHYCDKDIIVTHSKISNQVLIPEIQGEDGVIQMSHVSLLNEVSITKNKAEKEVLYSDFETPSMYFEFKALAKALKAKNIEAFPGAHQLSLDIHEVLTEARRQTNVVYPADKK